MSYAMEKPFNIVNEAGTCGVVKAVKLLNLWKINANNTKADGVYFEKATQ